MATYTPNYNLSKPESTDTQSDYITAYCGNLDIIDQHMDDGGDSVSWNQIQLSGDKIAEININGTTTDVYSPTAPTYTAGDGIDITSNVISVDSSYFASVAFSGDYDDLINKPTIPTKTSDLTNDSDFVSDANYVHTDNNFTSTEKTKLSGIASGAEVNVQSDWSQTDNTKDDFIKNKPTAENKTATTEFYTVNGGLLQKCIINLEPVQSGSGTPAPDNVRPISGHTEVDLANVGKNKCPNATSGTYGNVVTTVNSDGSVSFSGSCNANASCDFFRSYTALPYGVKPNETYTISLGAVFNRFDIYYSNDGATFIGTPLIQMTSTSNATFLLPSDATGMLIRAYLRSGSNYNVTIYPQIEKGNQPTTYEPYKGNLYQVIIGETVYGVSVDLVTGIMTVDREFYTATWGQGSSATVLGNNTRKVLPSLTSIPIISDGDSNIAPYLRSYSSDTPHFYVEANRQIFLILPNNTSDDTVIQICTYLATPITIKLPPQQISALIGENNLSTPLSGQTIDEVTYREVFGFDDVEKATSVRVPIEYLGANESGNSTASRAYTKGEYFYKDGYICTALADIALGATLTLNTNYSESTLDDVLESKISRDEFYNNAGSHNSIYRRKYLGSSVSASQWSAIQNGTFEDLFIGDYWTINNKNWRIAHFDYWLGTGDTKCTDHHVVIVPDTVLYNAKMNSSNVTTGGYYNSEMRGGANYLVQGSSGLYDTKVAIDNAFGSSHILSHRELLTNATSNGNASGWAWYDSTVDLMSEVMVYGHLDWSVGGKGYETGIDKEQLALFRLDHSSICNRAGWWLRGVGSAAYFALVGRYGYADSNNASYSYGVRPAFAIK